MSAGYEFIPISREVRRQARPEARFDRRLEGTVQGVFKLLYEVEQPVHVGAGRRILLPDGTIVRAGIQVLGGPGIPGSSVKGAIRSRFEAITSSCLELTKGRVQVRSSSYPDVHQASFDSRLLDSSRFGPCRDVQSVCPACALFGRMSLRSRVSVLDAYTPLGTAFQVAEMLEQFGPNLHHVGNFRLAGFSGKQTFEVQDIHGRKFALGVADLPSDPRFRPKYQKVQVIPAGAKVHAEVRFLNLTPAELGGLSLAVGLLGPSAIKVGAGKGLGFGRIRLKGKKLLLKQWNGQPFDLPQDAWLEAFKAWSDAWLPGLEKLIALFGKEARP